MVELLDEGEDPTMLIKAGCDRKINLIPPTLTRTGKSLFFFFLKLLLLKTEDLFLVASKQNLHERQGSETIKCVRKTSHYPCLSRSYYYHID